MLNSKTEARAVDHADLENDAEPAEAVEVVVKEPAHAPAPSVIQDRNAAKFGSAESTLDQEVAADIEDCNRANGSEEIFESQEERVRRRLPNAYKSFRRAMVDPAYCMVLAKKLFDESGGEYQPSAKKPANLATHMALKPKAEHVTQAYEAAYYYHHAWIADISIESFPTWIDGRNLKESRDFVRSRKKLNSAPKSSPYPNLAKARTLKKDAEVAKILKVAKDLAEAELASLFASRDSHAANA